MNYLILLFVKIAYSLLNNFTIILKQQHYLS